MGEEGSFKLIITPYAEEGEGQKNEIIRVAENLGHADFLSKTEVEKLGELAYLKVCENEAVVPKGILLCEREFNVDLVKSVRTALAMGAEGMVMKVGTNPMREYVLSGQAYSMKEYAIVVAEVKRLLPLYNRKLGFVKNY